MITDLQCRRRLGTLWLVATGAVIVLLMVESGIFGSSAPRAWTWFGAWILPTAMVVLGAVMKEAFDPHAKPVAVDPFVYRTAMTVSGGYLLLVGYALLHAAAANVPGVPADDTPLARLEASAMYLTPIQGFVGLATGAFFSKTAVK